MTAGAEDHPADARHRSHDALGRPGAAVVLLVDPRLQEDVVVHREPEEDREHEEGHEGDDRHVAIDPEQARAPAPLEDGDDDAVGRGDRQQVEDG
jgi:hypothetical protein